MRVQAGVVQNLGATQSQINALVSSSQSATGALQAAQSGNQLCGLAGDPACRPYRGDGRDRPRPKPRGRAQGRKSGAGPAVLANFLYYGAGYQPAPCRCFTDARPLVGNPRIRPRRLASLRLLCWSSWPPSASIAARASPRRRRPPLPCPPIPSAGELARCRAIGLAAADDADCKAAWAEKPPPVLWLIRA